MSDGFGLVWKKTKFSVKAESKKKKSDESFKRFENVSQTKNLNSFNNRISIRLFIRPSIFKSDEKSDRFAAALTTCHFIVLEKVIQKKKEAKPTTISIID